jgi:hypothetical protein
MIVLITMTGARGKQFTYCADYMRRQTYKGAVTWLIVDDAEPVTTNIVASEFKENWTIEKIHPKPNWTEGQNTQGRNIRAAIERVKQLENVDAIFIIEDDDWYSPNYLAEMVVRLGKYDIVGEQETIYYNVASRYWYRNPNYTHASLFQTAFTPAVIPVLESCYNEKFIDMAFWNKVKNKHLFRCTDLAIGIKGMGGRCGIGAGHNMKRESNDPEMMHLKKLIGADYLYYSEFFGNFNKGVPSNYIVVEPQKVVNINNMPL